MTGWYRLVTVIANPFLDYFGISVHDWMKQREKTIPPQGHVRLPASLDRLTDLDTATDTRRLEEVVSREGEVPGGGPGRDAE